MEEKKHHTERTTFCLGFLCDENNINTLLHQFLFLLSFVYNRRRRTSRWQSFSFLFSSLCASFLQQETKFFAKIEFFCFFFFVNLFFIPKLNWGKK